MDYSRWIGRTRSREAQLDPWPAQALQATLGRGEGPAIGSGDPLPCLWHWIYFLETPDRAAIGPDGHPRRGDFLPSNLPERRMFAGARTTIVEPLRIGSPAQVFETLVEVVDKRTGPDALSVVTMDYRYVQDGRDRVRETRDFVYLASRPRPATEIQPPPPAAPVEASDGQIVPDAVMLLRYSALTFNAHRIHYDRDYATREEGYPERVVHGPLTATLLVEHLRRSGVGELEHFEFRAKRPLFVNAPLSLRHRAPADGAWEVEALTPDGEIAMAAKARSR
jgi:3-methylfumaryl-CoA hydratase